MTNEELQARCAFLERELGEVGIQLDAAQKRLKLADVVIESMRGVVMSVLGLHAWQAERALDAWDTVPGDERREP